MPNVIETADAAANSSTTYTLGIGQTARGVVSAAGDHDFYRVNLVAGQTYTFALTGTGSNLLVDTYLRLYAANGTTQLAFNDDSLPNANSIITYTATTTGAYYLDAAAFSGTATGQYGLSATLGTRADFDLEMGAGVIDTHATWTATRGTGVVVTYGFRQSPATYTVTGSDITTFTQVSAQEQAAVQAMLAYYSEICGITFQQVNAGGFTDNASILIGNYNDATDGAGAFAYYPGPTASTNQAGDVWLNRDSISTTSLPLGSYSFLAIMHELGHALGLSHPGLYNAAPNVAITYANDAQFVEDSNMYSIMSYFAATNTGGPNARPDTPMLLDVLALQQIYGANMTTRTGNSVYGFGSNAGSVYDFAVNLAPVFTIWDAGGIDTIDASGFAMSQTINLNAGTFSSIGGLTNNISIAVGAVIENAVGGAGSDTIIGNNANDLLIGGGGNDIITGGTGADTIIGGSGADQLMGGLGSDAIYFDNFDTVVDGGANGGSDFNWAIALNATTGVNFNVGARQFQGVSGTQFADVLDASAATWNVTLVGQGGGDQLIGGSGNDALYFDNQTTLLQGGGGFDWAIDYNSAAISLTLTNAMSIEGVAGSAFNDIIDASAMTTAVTLIGLGGADTLRGGSGADALYFDNLDTITGGAGFDWAFAMGTTAVSLNMTAAGIEGATGTSGNDIFNATGSTVGVYVFGNDGNDTFYNGNAADQFNGGNGIDTLIYSGVSTAYTIQNAGGGTYLVTIGGVTDTVSGVEFLQFSNTTVALP